MRIALSGELLDGPPCGMRVALEGFLCGVAQLGLEDHFTIVRGQRDAHPSGFDEMVVLRRQGPASGLQWSQYSVPKAVLKSGHDLLHWPYQVGPPVRANPPLVVSVWDLAPLHFRTARWPWYRAAAYYDVLLRGSVRSARRVIAHSKAIAAEVMQHFDLPASGIDVVYPGLSGPFEREIANAPAMNPDGPILFVGANTGRKNLPLLVEAYGILVRQGIRNHLVLRTDFTAAQNAALQAALDQYSVPREMVEIVGPQNEEGLLDLYRGASVFALPSTYEGFGLPLLEAMAFGLPTVALDQSAMTEVVGDVGSLVSEPTPLAFAAGLIRALEVAKSPDSGDRTSIKRRASRFQWGEAVEKTMDAYRRATR